VVFPELSLVGYPPDDLLLRNELFDRVELALQSICHSIPDINVILGLPRKLGQQKYNAAVVIKNQKVVAWYYKHCLPNYRVFDEKRYFDSGSSPCVININSVAIGITICEDIWNPEPAKLSVDAGAEVIININASPFRIAKQRQRWSTVCQRVSELGVPVIYLNMLAGQDELVFDGGSFVVNRSAELVHQTALFDDAPLLIKVESQQGKIDVFEGQIIQCKNDIKNAYNAIVLGLRDYVNKNGFSGAIIGLSGGIDSALTLALAVDALGADRVEVVMMPSRYTAQMSLDDARKQAETMSVSYSEISIEPVFKSFVDLLKPEFKGLEVDVTEENIQARCRGVILMAISNKKRKILLTTGNKSEMAVGYATLYGDMAGGFAPIKDVPKTMVYDLAKYRNKVSSVIPERVITRAPSAELAPDQIDQDSLPSYEILDKILEGYIEQDLSIEKIIEQGFDVDTVKKIARLVDINEYKRRQSPPGVRITTKAFGRDRRYPITSGFGRY